jgi:hypothetical protein
MDLAPGIKWPAAMHGSMWYARAVINQVHYDLFQYGATCTSGFREQSPGGSSLHLTGKAMDVRTKHLNEGQLRQFAEMVKIRLGRDFDVVIEGPFATNPKYKDRPPHLHIEWDPKDTA